MPKPKLYFSRNYNPRLAVAAARFLKSPVEFEFASPFSPEQSAKFLKLNPNQSVPILVEEDKTFWEADAIACRLSQLAASDFWPLGDSLPDVVRWISWGYWNFVRACDQIHFERVTKQRYASARCDRMWCDRDWTNSPPRRPFWNTISAPRTGSSGIAQLTPISVSPASCRSRTLPAFR